MFEFLKDLLGVPRPVTVVGYEKPEVIFECASPLDLGVVGVLADIEGVKVKAQVQVVESGEQSCRALWLAPKEVLPLLIEVFTPSEKRRAERYKRRLRVRSTKLDGFQGNTLDLSKTGMRLEGKGDFQPGEIITITFDLDDARETQLTVDTQVCWIGPAENADWRAMGLRFQDFNESQRSEDFSFYQSFLEKISH